MEARSEARSRTQDSLLNVPLLFHKINELSQPYSNPGKRLFEFVGRLQREESTVQQVFRGEVSHPHRVRHTCLA
jgi:hypothetical protein